MGVLKRYRYMLAIVGVNMILVMVRPELGLKAF